MLTDKQTRGLIITLNCELRVVGGEAAHELNEIFRQLVGRDHDVYARRFPERTKPNEPWYQE